MCRCQNWILDGKGMEINCEFVFDVHVDTNWRESVQLHSNSAGEEVIAEACSIQIRAVFPLPPA